MLISPKNLIPTQGKTELSGSVVKRLAKDMKAHGFDPAKPIKAQVGASGRIFIIDGHHRVQAALKAGIAKIPVDVFVP